MGALLLWWDQIGGGRSNRSENPRGSCKQWVPDALNEGPFPASWALYMGATRICPSAGNRP